MKQLLLCCFILIVFSCGSAAQSSPEPFTQKLSANTDKLLSHGDNDCDPELKAATLNTAIGGSYPTINSDLIVDVLIHCTREQRAAVVASYNAQYSNNDFLSVIKSQCDYWSCYTITALVQPLPEFLARELNWAVKGMGTDEDTIIQILTSLNNNEVTKLKYKYEELFGSDLRDDVLDDISGEFAAIADSQIRGVRNENTNVNETAAALIAQKIYKLGLEGQNLGVHNRLFFQTMTQMSFPRLRKVSEELTRLNYPLKHALEEHFSGWDLRAYSAIAKCAEGKVAFFTDELKRTIDAIDIRATIRLMTWRADIDLGNIRQILHDKYRIKI